MKRSKIVRRVLPVFVVSGLLAAIPFMTAGASSAAGSGSSSSAPYSRYRSTIQQYKSISAVPQRGMGSYHGLQSHEYTRGIEAMIHAKESRASTAGPRASEEPLLPPTVEPTAVDGSTGLVKSWQGLDAFDQRFANNGNQFSVVPPDQGMCVGGGYVVEAVNTVMQVFTTTGKAVNGPVDLNSFFGYPPQFNRTTFKQGPFITDPSCVFDHQFGHFYLVVLTLDVVPKTGAFTLTDHLDIAVSSTSNPTQGWVFYHIPVTNDGSAGTPRHRFCPCVGDFPHIGLDTYGFYITTNEYPFSDAPGIYGNNYNGANLYAIPKDELAQREPRIAVTQFGKLALPDGTPGFTLWPSNSPDSAYDTSRRGTEWFPQSTAAQETNNPSGMSDTLGIWRLTNTRSLATPGDLGDTLQLHASILHSEVYGVPPPSEQKVGPVPLRDCLTIDCLGFGQVSKFEFEEPLDSSDSRTLTAWWVHDHLMTALDTTADVNGRLQAAIAWFVIDTSTRPVSMGNQGYLGIEGNAIYPSIATNTEGEGVMGFNIVGAKYFPSSNYVHFNDTGPFGDVQFAARGKAPDDDFCQYKFFNCAFPLPGERPRWGDYSAAAEDNGNLWIATEYIGSSCTFDEYLNDPTCGGTRAALINWSTRISQVG